MSKTVWIAGTLAGFFVIHARAQTCVDDLCFVDRGNVTGEIDLGSPRGGISVLDFDTDGFPDLVVGDELGLRTRLYHNVPSLASSGARTFEEVGAGSGLDDEDGTSIIPFAITTADYDNDGDPDVFMSGFSIEQGALPTLYRNDGAGQFTNVGASSGIRALGVGAAAAAWHDFDLDGALDLTIVGVSTPLQVRLLRNNGDGTFSDATALLPVFGGLGAVYGIAWVDYDDDGWQDCFLPGGFAPLVLKNVDDGVGGRLFINVTQTVGFTSIGVAPMGIAVGDRDNDGDFDLTISDAHGGTYYDDVGDGVLRVFPYLTMFAWGVTLLDADNDGDLDDFQAGSFITPRADSLVRNLGGGQYESVSPALNGVAAASQHAVQIDYNNDGRRDIVVLNPGSPERVVSVYENISTTANHWVGVQLRGDGVTVNRDGIGATVWVTAGGSTQMRAVLTGTSTTSTEDLRVHFGLGDVTQIDEIRVLWPTDEPMEQRLEIYPGPFPIDEYITLTRSEAPCETVYGDIFPPGPPTGDCVVSLDDILCVLRGFGDLTLCPTGDIRPCVGDGVINIDDLLGILRAFSGEALCP